MKDVAHQEALAIEGSKEVGIELMRARRESNAQALAALARQGQPITLNITDPKLAPAPPYRYEQVGMILYKHFAADPNAAMFKGAGGIQHGFRTVARIAKWGIAAYMSHCIKAGQTPSLEELNVTLRESYRPALTTFSSVPVEVSNVLESAFGLKALRPPQYEPIPFRITSDDATTSGLQLIPSPYSMQEVWADHPEFADVEPMPKNRCHAAGIMLRQVWDGTVETCTISPGLFPRDLADLDISKFR